MLRALRIVFDSSGWTLEHPEALIFGMSKQARMIMQAWVRTSLWLQRQCSCSIINATLRVAEGIKVKKWRLLENYLRVTVLLWCHNIDKWRLFLFITRLLFSDKAIATVLLLGIPHQVRNFVSCKRLIVFVFLVFVLIHWRFIYKDETMVLYRSHIKRCDLGNLPSFDGRIFSIDNGLLAAYVSWNDMTDQNFGRMVVMGRRCLVTLIVIHNHATATIGALLPLLSGRAIILFALDVQNSDHIVAMGSINRFAEVIILWSCWLAVMATGTAGQLGAFRGRWDVLFRWLFLGELAAFDRGMKGGLRWVLAHGFCHFALVAWWYAMVCSRALKACCHVVNVFSLLRDSILFRRRFLVWSLRS